MACALEAQGRGKSVIIADREKTLGGILPQCVHNGFGLGYFKEDIKGFEYGERFARMVEEQGIPVLPDSSVLKVSADKKAEVMTPDGMQEIAFDKLVFATGCRELTIYPLGISGTRPAGIMTCGMAQKLMNIDGAELRGNIVILGSGDIGQIVARQLVMQGLPVTIIEKEKQIGGMRRNQVACIDAYNIPVLLNSEIEEILGEGHIKGLRVRNTRTGGQIILKCDMLLTAIGLVPELELAKECGFTDENWPEWAFKTGNCDYVHQIVDSVTEEAQVLGREIS